MINEDKTKMPGTGWHYATFSGPIEIVYVNNADMVLMAGTSHLRSKFEFRFFGPVPLLNLTIEQRQHPFDYSIPHAIGGVVYVDPSATVDLDKVLAETDRVFDPDPMVQQVSAELARQEERKKEEALAQRAMIVNETTDNVLQHIRSYMAAEIIETITKAVLAKIRRSLGA